MIRTEPERRHDIRLDQDARHVARCVRLPRQEMAQDLPNRIARQDHVAEALAAAVFVRDVEGDAVDGRIGGQEARKLGELIGGIVAGEIGKVVGHLLQAEHIEIGHAAGMGDEARKIDASVDAAAPLHVPGDELHRYPQRMPARMKLCTNWRWKRRKPIKSGAEVISVAAQITAQSMP